MSARIAGVALILGMIAATACGDDSAVPTVLVIDECNVNGPSRVADGFTRLTLQRSGLGDIRATLVILEDGHLVSELEEHFERVDRAWEQRPDWARVRYVLEVDDDAGSPRSDTVLMELDPGEHAIVCINLSNGRVAKPVALQVVDKSG